MLPLLAVGNCSVSECPKMGEINKLWSLIFINWVSMTEKLSNVDKSGCTPHLHVATKHQNISLIV